jgi:hypothetical protein
MLGLAANEGLEPHQLSGRFSMATTRIIPLELRGLNAYAEAFERNIRNLEV